MSCMLDQKGQYIKIYLYTSRFIHLYQDLFIKIKILIRLVYIKIHIQRDCDRLTRGT